MKKVVVGLIVLLLNIGFSSYALGEDNLTVNKSVLTPPINIEVGYELSSFHYSEPGVMDEDGLLHGVRGVMSGHFENNFMVGISLRLSVGGLDYDGQTMAGTPVTADTDDFVFSLRSLFGYDFDIGRSIITPLTGICYRYWNDDLSGTTGGYEREIKYWYSPIGFETASLTKEEKWIWGLRAEYDFFLVGQVTSHLSDVHPGYNDPVNDQNFGDGYGARGSVYFKRPKNVEWPLSIEVFIRYWDIDQSDTATWTYYGLPLAYVVEPTNDTTEYGLQLSMQW